MENTNTATGKKNDIMWIAICAVFTALTCVFTMMIQIPTGPLGGMVHLGNVPFMIAAALWGKRTGAIAGGIGMALSDLLTGWQIYAPITLITVGLMGFVYASIIDRKPTVIRLVLAYLAATAIKVAGYYIGEVILYHNFASPLVSIPGNVVQMTVGALIASPVIAILKSACGNLIDKMQPASHRKTAAQAAR